ncbi:hypothetical protein BJX76DRAFT_323011 [Aspergillus varians]
MERSSSLLLMSRWRAFSMVWIQFDDSIGRLSSTKQGIYVASILLSFSVSSLTSGHASDRISRKYGILFVGNMTVYFIAFGSHNIAGSFSWRVPFIIQAAVAAVFCLGVVLVPFSPRWLAQVGRTDDAKQVLCRLGAPSAVEAELEEIRPSLDPEKRR